MNAAQIVIGILVILMVAGMILTAKTGEDAQVDIWEDVDFDE